VKTAPRIRIDLGSPVAAGRQIVDAIRAHLVEGELAPGDVLPSVRRLAMELGVHFNTVAQAYRQLAEEGWLDLKHGRRAAVIGRGPVADAGPDKVLYFQRRLREMVAEMRAHGVAQDSIADELRLFAERLKS
jgi:DNA-binding transcriptional regulator YhcF (GntR family)